MLGELDTRDLEAIQPADGGARVVRDLAATVSERPELYQFRSLVGGHQYMLLYELVRKYARPEGTVLDWGAGNGHFSYFLVRAGYKTVGYSLYRSDVAEWLEDGDYRLVVGDPADPVSLPFEEASFDAVVSVGVLEHVRDTGGEERASLREIRRVLRPAGTFLCYHFPNRYSWIDAVARVMPGVYHHPYRYTRRDIRELVAAADLQLLEAGSYALLPRNPLYRLPARVAQSERLARAYDGVDRALSALLPALSQNRYFVARKPD